MKIFSIKKFSENLHFEFNSCYVHVHGHSCLSKDRVIASIANLENWRNDLLKDEKFDYRFFRELGYDIDKLKHFLTFFPKDIDYLVQDHNKTFEKYTICIEDGYGDRKYVPMTHEWLIYNTEIRLKNNSLLGKWSLLLLIICSLISYFSNSDTFGVLATLAGISFSLHLVITYIQLSRLEKKALYSLVFAN